MVLAIEKFPEFQECNNVTNPYYPISALYQVVAYGRLKTKWRGGRLQEVPK